MKRLSHTVHVVSHTHWDREWYQPFEVFRFQLVRLIDELIDVLEHDPEFHSFMLDGQTILLEDYLDIRPSNRGKLEKCVRQGRLKIGPWYVLADEFLVSGEALIRNLLFGKRIGEEFGQTMKVGYVPDSFGHISQLPQILSGFGIQTAVFFRGLGDEPGQDVSEYRWLSPDGSQVLLVHLPSTAYANTHSENKKRNSVKALNALLDELKKRSRSGHLLVLNGGDHCFVDRKITKSLFRFNRRPGERWIHTDLEHFFSEIGRIDSERFPVCSGELRSGYTHSPMLQGVMSARIPLKQKNDACQVLLEKLAEPLNVRMTQEGASSRTPWIRHAWKILLQNHPHDSICGSSVDEVHREMETRFSRCKQVGTSVMADLCRWKWGQPDPAAPEQTLILWNPLPFQRGGVFETEWRIIVSNPSSFGRFENPGFRFVDEKDRPIPFQILGETDEKGSRFGDMNFPYQTGTKRIAMLLDIRSMPAMGSIRVKLQKGGGLVSVKDGVKVDGHILENRWLRIEILPNGTLSVQDKERDVRIQGLHAFEDSGDVGDEYNHSHPETDSLYCSRSFPCRISTVENGPLRAAIRIRVRMKVPARSLPGGRGRSEEKGLVSVWSTVRLDARSPRVEFETCIRNEVSDHRFRVLFPTGLRTDESHAWTSFHAVRRIIQIPDSGKYSIEVPSLTHPMQGFVTVMDKVRGVSLFTRGLYEYELKKDDGRTLALTLIRGVGMLSKDDLVLRPSGHAGPPIKTPDAQCQGLHRFHYALHFHDPVDDDFSSVLREFESYRIGPISHQVPEAGIHGQERSWIDVEPETLCVTTVKEAEDRRGFLVRLLNPSHRNVKGTIACKVRIRESMICRLDETDTELLEVRRNRVTVNVPPWGLRTVRFVPLG